MENAASVGRQGGRVVRHRRKRFTGRGCVGARGDVKGLRFMAYGVGTLVSLFGTRFEEYRTVHGT